MEFVYTDSGRKELEHFHAHQQQLLEKIVSSRKYVFGDDVVEITRADVQQAAQCIKPLVAPRTGRYSSMRIAAKAYLFIGLVLFAAGLTWPYLQAIYTNNKFAFGISVGGLFMAMLGALLLETLRSRAKIAEESAAIQNEFREASLQQTVSGLKTLSDKK